MQTRQLYHGTNGDNILSIMDSGKLKPNDEFRIYFSENRWESVLMYGVDRLRHAAFATKVKVVLPDEAMQYLTSTPGNPYTLILQTFQPVEAKVLELYVRKPVEDGFSVEHVIGESAIRNYLQL